MQAQVKTESQLRGLFGVQRRQCHVHALTQPADLATGNEVQALAVELEFQGIFDTTDVADANGEKRRVEPVIGKVFLDSEPRRQRKKPTDAIVGMKQPRLVNPPGAQLGLHLAVELEAFRQEVQTTALFADVLITLVGFFTSLPGAHHFAIRHHQQRTAHLLAETGTAGNVVEHAVAQLLTVADHTVDHQQRDQQQQNQQGNRPEF
ncbi:hypothetical protein D3C72_520670 [compost metagenome]